MMLERIKKLPAYAKARAAFHYRINTIVSKRVFNHETALRLHALADSAGFAAVHMKDALATSNKNEVMDAALTAIELDGLIAEFGVWRGTTINHIACRYPERTIHGFDSFEGLPEDWFGKYTKDRFDRQGVLPAVRENVRLHKGWFDETLPTFAAEHPENVAFLHVDCDLYSSTATIFKYLGDRIVAGTVILFDEYFNYPNWRDHEHRAFSELVEERKLNYSWVAYNTSEMNAAVRIEAG